MIQSNDCEKKNGNNFISILTSYSEPGMENAPLGSVMWFRLN